MIVVKVELHSAVTGRVTTLGTAVIDNVGGTTTLGNYRARVYRKGAERSVGGPNPPAYWPLLQKTAQREGNVKDHPRLAEPVWSLVRKALVGMGY